MLSHQFCCIPLYQWNTKVRLYFSFFKVLAWLTKLTWMFNPCYPLIFYHSSNMWCKLQITKLLIKQFSPPSCYLIPLRSTYSPQQTVLEHPQCVLPLMWETNNSFHVKIKELHIGLLVSNCNNLIHNYIKSMTLHPYSVYSDNATNFCEINNDFTLASKQ
jgi:hypothetical protein